MTPQAAATDARTERIADVRELCRWAARVGPTSRLQAEARSTGQLIGPVRCSGMLRPAIFLPRPLQCQAREGVRW